MTLTKVVDGQRVPMTQAEIDAFEASRVPLPPPIPILTPVQFEYMLAVSGLDEVWDQVEATLKAAGMMEEYAKLRAQKKKTAFHFDVVLAFVDQFSAQIPDGVDVSEETLRTRWDSAAAKTDL